MQAKAESCPGREGVSNGWPAANYVDLERLHRLLINQEYLLNFAQCDRGQCTSGFDGDRERMRFILGTVVGGKLRSTLTSSGLACVPSGICFLTLTAFFVMQ